MSHVDTSQVELTFLGKPLATLEPGAKPVFGAAPSLPPPGLRLPKDDAGRQWMVTDGVGVQGDVPVTGLVEVDTGCLQYVETNALMALIEREAK